VPLKPAVLCDLDGVVWLTHQPIPGSVDAIARIREAGHRVLFVTNNSYATADDQARILEEIGIPALGDVVTASQAAGSLLASGDRVLTCGGPGVTHAIQESGAVIVGRSDDPNFDMATPVDAVVVAFHRTFDFAGLTRLSAKIRDGARFIATNDDATYPTRDGVIPGGGSIVAAVAAASGVQPHVAGKPNEPMAAMVRRVLDISDLSSAWMVGDRASTDGQFARTVGCRFAHVQSGVGNSENELAHAAFAGVNLAAFADFLIGQKR
jgi:HAD superfamily hydrolase (TIGR01450 family)